MLARLSVVHKTVLSVLLIGILIFSGTRLVSGQNSQGNGLALSTLVEEVEGAAGSRVTLANPIVVKNVTQSDLSVEVNFNDFLPSEDESGTPQIIVRETEEPNEFGIKEYFQPIDNFTLAPDETIEIPVTLDIPTNATPGGHYGVVRFTAVNSAQEDQDVTLSASVGTIVLLNVPGEEVEDIDLVEFSAAKNGNTGSFFTSGPIGLVTRFQNVGNTHVAPFGKITVKNFFGSTVEEVEFNANQTRRGFVLPDSIRRFETELEGSYNFGRYSVTGNISYGDGGDIIELGTSFWVLPWKIILGVLAGLVIIVGGGRIFLKSYAKKIEKKSRRF